MAAFLSRSGELLVRLEWIEETRYDRNVSYELRRSCYHMCPFLARTIDPASFSSKLISNFPIELPPVPICLLPIHHGVCHQRPRGKLAHFHGVLADNTITEVEVARLLLQNSFSFSFVNFVSMLGRKSSPPCERW